MFSNLQSDSDDNNSLVLYEEASAALDAETVRQNDQQILIHFKGR
jgi:hypothetical protein